MLDPVGQGSILVVINLPSGAEDTGASFKFLTVQGSEQQRNRLHFSAVTYESLEFSELNHSHKHEVAGGKLPLESEMRLSLGQKTKVFQQQIAGQHIP